MKESGSGFVVGVVVIVDRKAVLLLLCSCKQNADVVEGICKQLFICLSNHWSILTYSRTFSYFIYLFIYSLLSFVHDLFDLHIGPGV